MVSQTHYELALEIGQWLRQREWRIATAESCTAGGIGYALSAIPGSSAWLEGGFITYSNALKMHSLGVPEQTLITHGAVSAETALAMATGARQQANCDMAVAVTGIAGPDGGSATKPVGLVWFGLAWPDGQCSWACQFDGDRAAVREATISEALRSFKKIT
ncbi:CinA family protein [Pseudidiomarina sediminum]|uniref:CinA family protein n=1 Tax=Pseudidiomarina sediminum TaxID=431675 RepID=UPI001C95AD6C|nr:CinA family protein [Pseudidiomarina sediminum]MBY6063166.1 CinA family protein [Pseudidiomarina sediminum]